MFGRWRKGKDEAGITCPLCGEVSPDDTVECPKCYHQLGKSIIEQNDGIDQEVSSSLFDELLADDEDEDDGEIVDWSKHSFEMDDVTIDVSQYEEDSESVSLSAAPNFAAIVDDVPTALKQDTTDLDDGEYELTSKDAPKNVEKFVVPDTVNDTTPIEEPEHRVDLVVPLLPSGATEISDDEEIPLSDPSDVKDDDEIEATQTSSSISVENTASTEAPAPKRNSGNVKPTIPQLPGLKSTEVNGATAPALPTLPTIPTKESTTTKNSGAPSLPAMPSSRPNPDAFSQTVDIDTGNSQEPIVNEVPSREGEMWPWPQQDAYDDLTVKKALRQVMELVKAGDIANATRSLDKLGPHLGDRIEILFHVGVVLKKIGREDALRTMLESARRLHPDDQHVATALTSLGM